MIELLRWSGSADLEVARRFFTQGRQRFNVDNSGVLLMRCGCPGGGYEHAARISPGGTVRYDGQRYWHDRSALEVAHG